MPFKRCSMPDRDSAVSYTSFSVYKKVFPCEVEDAVQLNMFAQDNYVPGCLIGKTFVVFDIETTGLDATTEKITEIGAVKIVDGKFVDVDGEVLDLVGMLAGVYGDMAFDLSTTAKSDELIEPEVKDEE